MARPSFRRATASRAFPNFNRNTLRMTIMTAPFCVAKLVSESHIIHRRQLNRCTQEGPRDGGPAATSMCSRLRSPLSPASHAGARQAGAEEEHGGRLGNRRDVRAPEADLADILENRTVYSCQGNGRYQLAVDRRHGKEVLTVCVHDEVV